MARNTGSNKANATGSSDQDYGAFLDTKRQLGGQHGFGPVWMPEFLFPFQAHLVEWAIRKGRAAIFADCGLGKSPMQLVWAENVVRKTNRPVLIAAPLAVSPQVLEEAEKFGVECVRSRDGKIPSGARVVVTNYERLHLFDPADVTGLVCDESSILKNFDGVRKATITEFMRTLPYRLLCTATAAPNDYTELGTSSEALGEMGHMDMLQRFFRNDRNTLHAGRSYGQAAKWRLKGHAEDPFWRWVCSWARACRKPSDLGFEDAGFELPPLIENEHLVSAGVKRDGWLFEEPAIGLREEREEMRRTIKERCDRVAELVNGHAPALVWCHLNAEGDRLAKVIPDALQVKGSDKDEVKEERLQAFAKGELRVLVTKPNLLMFRRKGENPVPVEHPNGLLDYAGAREIPHELLPLRGYEGKQTENSYSQWIWRQYASAFWDDVRIDRVLPFKPARDEEDIRHVHPLQLDVIDRCVSLWSNPGETVMTPFMGVGSEVYCAVELGRRGVGVELKDTYYRQAKANIERVKEVKRGKQMSLIAGTESDGRATPGGEGYPGASRAQYFKSEAT